jgi:hypothetical protein
MATVGCLRCGVWYDPARPHLCGLLADETARGLAERIDAFERRLQGLDGEARSRLNALERRIQELAAAQAQGACDRADEDAPSRVRILLPHAPSPPDDPPVDPEPIAVVKRDRRADHARYMRQWRLRRAMRGGDVHA